ncbi:MAG: PepSY domain-containing protein [Candidatus Woesearchaeota archaeon]|nr:PepSY domain-containing protein [Candidatus Woesearchaeota archaeon]
MKTKILFTLLALLIIAAACTRTEKIDLGNDVPEEKVDTTDIKPEAKEEYDPLINPADFSSVVDNKYFKLTPGKKTVYEGMTQDGLERVEVYVLDERKIVMGVETIVVWDRVWLDGDLIEETKDWYAQDKDGNVWYFGEDTAELLEGEVLNHNGAWEAGVNGAKPGIIMLGNPKIGDSYYQEYYEGIAEDMADVLSLDESVKVPSGSYTGCLKTRDYTLFDIWADEHKYYCPQVGDIALEIELEDGEKIELKSVQYDSEPSPSYVPKTDAPKTSSVITEEEAREIALARVPGEVTDIAKEKKFGKICYVVEIDADEGTETDVVIEAATGEILAVEE